MAPKTIAANAIAAVFPDVFMVSISDAATRVTESTGLTYSNEALG